MRDKGFLDIDSQPGENQRPGIGCRRAQGVEVHLFTPEIIKRLDFRSHEYVKLRGEKVQDIGDLLLDVRHLRLVFLHNVRVDDRHIHPLQIKKGVDVLGGAAGHDRQDMGIVAIVHDPCDLGRQAERRPFQLTTRETDRPGVYLFPSAIGWRLCVPGRPFPFRNSHAAAEPAPPARSMRQAPQPREFSP